MNNARLAWELAEVFGELSTEHLNEVLAKNVPLQTLEFFNDYADTFGKTEGVSDDTTRRLPNLMLVGYLLRILEDRLVEDPSFD